MKFINKGEPTKVRIREGPDRFRWITLRTGETINMDYRVGKRYGFQIVKSVEGSIRDKKLETKMIAEEEKEINNYYERLKKIRGIGKKTIKDILKVFPGEKELIKSIKSGNVLPFRDDIEALLKKEWQTD